MRFLRALALCVAVWSSTTTTTTAAPANITMRSTDRVVIVGGGPAGVHYATLLAKKGIKDIFILEADGAIGGKSRTEFDNRGRPQEMGTVFSLDTYTPVFDLVKRYNYDNKLFNFTFEKPGFMFAMGETIGAADNDTSSVMDFPQYLMTSVQRVAPPALQPRATVEQLKALFTDQAMRYMALHRQIFGVYEYGMPPKPKDWKLIDMTAMEFLQRNNLTALVGMLRFSQQMQGYGVLETIPAFYMLWWSHPDALSNILKAQLENRSCAYELRDGFQKLWKNMVDYHRGVIRWMNYAKVIAISRSAVRRSGSTLVTYRDFKGDNVTVECDHVVMAVDLSQYASIITDMVPEEAALFKGNYVTSAFSTTVFESPSSPVETAATIWPLRMKEDGRLCALRNTKLTLVNADPLNWGNLSQGLQVRVAYQFYNKPITQVDPLTFGNNQLVKDIKAQGMGAPALWNQMHVSYFPRFTPAGLKLGLPWRIFDIQGRRQTTWIGSSVCFESVLDVVTYNNNLIQYVNVVE